MRTALLLATLAAATAPKPDAASDNDFVRALYSEVRTQHGNVFFSPVSLREALGTQPHDRKSRLAR